METNEIDHHHSVPHWLVNTLGILLIVFVGILILQKGNDFKNAISDKKPANTLTVSAEGKVAATPDLAIATVGVMSDGTSAKDVQSKNNEKVNKIIEYVKSQGVAKEDITTSQFYASPTYDYRNGTSEITGYQANQTVTIKIHDIDKSTDKLDTILGGVTDNGVNTFQGVNLTFEDPDNLRQEARKLAIAKAKVKAQELAQEAGLTLGKIVSVSESGGYYSPMPYASDAMAMGRGGAEMKAVAPNIEPGSQDITQTMTVVYEVK